MSRFLLLIAAALSFTFLPSSAHAQACGDANGSGGINISDIVYMFNYLYKGGPPPVDFDLADVDFHQEWTMKDAYNLFWCLFSECYPIGYCPPTSPPWEPAVTAGFRIRHTAHFPAHLDHGIVDLALDAQRMFDFQLPLRISMDSIPAQIDSVQFPATGSELNWNYNILSILPTPGEFLLASISFGGSGSQPSTPLARVFFSAPVALDSRPITVEFADYVPAQAPPGHDNPITPMIVSWSAPVKPSIQATCCLAPGDANGSGACTISDAVYLINFYFGGGPGPMQCPALGDANGSGSLNISDAVWIINYIFMGGPAPLCS